MQMNFSGARHLLKRKYTLPLVALFIVFCTAPVVYQFPALHMLPVFLILSIVLFLLHVQRLPRPVFTFAAVCAAISFALDFYWHYFYREDHSVTSLAVASALFVPTIAFYATAIVSVVSRVFSENRVTSDTVWGGIFVYLLLGIFWAHLYHFAIILDPEALKPSVGAGDLFRTFYYSMITITTTGYGDITPGNQTTMMLAVLEAITGQIYIAVFVARLIGLEITHRVHK